MGYSFQLTARFFLYAPSHRQDSTYHGLCYTSCGASWVHHHEGSIRRPIAPWANALTTELHLAPQVDETVKEHGTHLTWWRCWSDSRTQQTSWASQQTESPRSLLSSEPAQGQIFPAKQNPHFRINKSFTLFATAVSILWLKQYIILQEMVTLSKQNTHLIQYRAWRRHMDYDVKEGRKEMFYLTTHSTHFIYGYMASDIW